MYCARVQTITYKEKMSHVEHSVLMHLALFRPTLHILPRLKKLSLRVDTSACLLDSMVLLSPSLSMLYLHIETDVSDQTVQTFFKTLEFYASKSLQLLSFSHRRTGSFVTPLCTTIQGLLQKT